MNRNRIMLLTLIGLTVLMGCKQEKKEVKEEAVAPVKARVFVSNYPLEFFVGQIAGDKVEVSPVYREADNLTSWSPSDSAMVEIQGADLIVLNGAGFESWVNTISLPQSRVVNTTAQVEAMLIEETEKISHSHGPDGEHEHAIAAYTTWLNLELAALQAKAVLDALVSLQPENKAIYESNYQRLAGELQELDAEMKRIGDLLQGEQLAFSHPVYQYLQQATGIKGPSFHWEPGQMPDKKQWHDFRHERGHHPFSVMIWEGEPGEEIRDKLTTYKVEAVVFNTLIVEPASGDFLSEMKKNVSALKEKTQ